MTENLHISPQHLQALAEALGDLRDNWTLVALSLKDQIAEQPSPERDALLAQIERYLARIRAGEHDPGTKRTEKS